MLRFRAAQQLLQSPPPICFSYNDWDPPGPLPEVGVSADFNGLTAHFAAPTSSTIERIDLWWAPDASLHTVTLELRQTTSLGGPSGDIIGSYVSWDFPHTGGWHAFDPDSITPPRSFAVVAGSTYALKIRGYLVGTWTGTPFSQLPYVCEGISHDPAAPTQLLYTLASTPACPATIPSSGTIGLMVRFRGAACGPGPPASGSPIGQACGSGFGPPSVLTAYQAPVLGGSLLVEPHRPLGRDGLSLLVGRSELLGHAGRLREARARTTSTFSRSGTWPSSARSRSRPRP